MERQLKRVRDRECGENWGTVGVVTVSAQACFRVRDFRFVLLLLSCCCCQLQLLLLSVVVVVVVAVVVVAAVVVVIVLYTFHGHKIADYSCAASLFSQSAKSGKFGRRKLEEFLKRLEMNFIGC